jgi:transcriptional regulator with XRE-family HTH domain
MEEFKQNEQSKRFLEELDSLLNQQKVYSDAEFCRILDYSPQSFSQIRKGRRNVTSELLELGLTRFAMDVIYILSGKKQDVRVDVRTDVRLDPDINPTEVNEPIPEYGNPKDDIAALKQRIRDLEMQNLAYLKAFEAMGRAGTAVESSKRNVA